MASDADKPTQPHLGYTTTAEKGKPFAAFFNPSLAPLSTSVTEALLRGPKPEQLFETPETITALLEDGYRPMETGFALTESGGMIVSCLTPMPGVSPKHWAWWLAWHGDDAAKYKLWHPAAHVDVAWEDGHQSNGVYVGRTSCVTEYIGSEKSKLRIPFVSPSAIGLDKGVLDRKGQVAICAKGLRMSGLPVEIGLMVHQIRPTKDGCEMRSRFWMGGGFVTPANFGSGLANALVRWIARTFMPVEMSTATSLLVHCAEEMAHLAALLPDLYEQFHTDEDRRS